MGRAMNFGDDVLDACEACGWTLRGRDVPPGRTIPDVMLAHRQGACPAATHLDGTVGIRPAPPAQDDWSPS
jgi:hypothetical protein